MPDIRHSIPIAAAPAHVYPLISSAAGFRQWWAEDVTESAETVELGFFKRATIYRLRLEVDRPPTDADWICDSGDQWGGTHLIFRLEPTASGTLLHFTHAGWKSETDYFVACTTTWGELMFRLKSATEGKPRGPLFLANTLAY